MKRLLSLVLLKICSVSLLLAAPGDAAVPPNNLIYASAFGSHTLNIKVFDNYLFKYVAHTYVIDDSKEDHYDISNVNTSQNGIVSWIETGKYNYKRFCHLLYDPSAVDKWPIGYSPEFQALTATSYQEVDGVVWCRGTDWFEQQLYNTTYFSTYNPLYEAWCPLYTYNITTTPENTPYDPVIKDGIVAFKIGFWPDWVNTRYYIYDHRPGTGWRSGIFPGDCDSLSIESCSVKIVVGSSTYYRGYNPNIADWQDGLSWTKSYFFATPTSGKKPLWVWFWDLSMGAYFSKLWDFGDGTTNGTPSYYHSYSKPGTYRVQQLVAGSYFDVTTTTIKVIGQGTPALPLLLLD